MKTRLTALLIMLATMALLCACSAGTHSDTGVSDKPDTTSSFSESKVPLFEASSAEEFSPSSNTPSGVLERNTETLSSSTSETESIVSKPTEEKTPQSETKQEINKSADTQTSAATTESTPKPIQKSEPVPNQGVKILKSTDVEAKVAAYVNQFRLADATLLNGLTSVARYRSQELVSNFSHTDGISACNALRYGEYVDMTLYGMSTEDSYYQGYNREAIAKGNWVGTAEEIAQSIAQGFKYSPSHWSYLGSSEYSYIAVGCTYDQASSMWYCCICISSKNYGG